MRSPELHRLIRHRDAAGVQALLATAGERAKALADERDDWGWAPLHHAVQLRPSEPEIVRLLLEAGADPNARHSGFISLKESVLHFALKNATVDVVRLLAKHGVDLRERTAHGYTSAHDACMREEGRTDPGLLDLLEFLHESGVDFEAGSKYGESPMNSLSTQGRFDAIRFLSDRGVSEAFLGWSPLHRIVAFGSLEDLTAVLAKNPNLEQRDAHDRTPFALAVAVGDLDKMEQLRSRGADVEAADRYRSSPLAVAAEAGRVDLIRWLLDHGADVHRSGFMGETPIKAAVKGGSAEAVQALVEAGAVVDGSDKASVEILDEVESAPVARWLLDAGADPRELRHDGHRVILGLKDNEGWLDQVSLEEFRQWRGRRFGRSNPEEMNAPFWLAMIRDGVNAYVARKEFSDDKRVACGGQDPVWCADRFGQSITFLPDGRTVQIGGEHEDGYDPDFCIYNDVFVHESDGTIRILGYPQDVFSTTDFHTANLVGDEIIVVGCLGYPEQRKPGFTPVYALNTATFAMKAIATTGASPGWIHKHRTLVEGRDLVVFGGEVWIGGKLKPCKEVYRLNLDSLVWSCTEEPAPYPQFRRKGLLGMMFELFKSARK